MGKPLFITDDEVALYVACREKNAGRPGMMEFRKLVPRLADKSDDNLKNRFKNLLQVRGIPTDFQKANRAVAYELPEGALITEALEELIVDYEDSLIFCDPHMPHHSRSIMARGFNVAEAQGIEHLILAGDTFDFDCFSTFQQVGAESAEGPFMVV